jgi:hypothetical protein
MMVVVVVVVVMVVVAVVVPRVSKLNCVYSYHGDFSSCSLSILDAPVVAMASVATVLTGGFGKDLINQPVME